PIPIVHWDDGTCSALEEGELPLVLPEVQDYKPFSDGQSPLAKAENWLLVKDPKTGRTGRRETNTMPQWAGSCWYYLRFIDPHNQDRGWEAELEKAWMPVDLYVGGAEHAVLHLLYSRFWHKVLYDLGFVSTKEPFKRLFNQGMLVSYAYKNERGILIPLDEVEEDSSGTVRHKGDGEILERITAKMSKSLRNVITTDDTVEMYGADTLRMFLMFMGPLEAMKSWDSYAISGVYRFLKKAWNYVDSYLEGGCLDAVPEGQEQRSVTVLLHQTIKKVSDNLDGLRFNTVVSTLMEFLNGISNERVCRSTLEKFVLMLSPMAPHLAEDLWQRLGHTQSLAYEAWPEYDPAFLKQDVVTVVLQVNGKKRATLEVPVPISADALKAQIIEHMAGTNYQVSDGDKFITVFDSATKAPKLVNVIRSA
ncbi:MAG: class I tRNA ligase family protein, partial [Deltaproteobacteria bacterium]|nr:class I tRNA ligase family protein [Deltaproteobacteria bacterium]